MIIVAGWARTGTSIMFRCLQQSGFYGGDEKELRGFPHKTEHNQFRLCNLLLMYYTVGGMSAKTVFEATGTMVKGGLRQAKGASELPLGVRRKMSLFMATIEKDGAEILKDPQVAPVMKEWLKFDEMFATAKYIWCRRNPIEAAKSFIRLKVPRIPQYRGVLTTKKALEIHALHEKTWAETLKDLDHREVWLENLIQWPEFTGEYISEFIGRDFDTSLISVDETYAARRKAS